LDTIRADAGSADVAVQETLQMSISKFRRRTVTRAKDAARYSSVAGGVAFARSLLGSRLSKNPVGRASHFLQAYRFTFRQFWLQRLAPRISGIQQLTDDELSTLNRRVLEWISQNGPLDRTVIVKAPGSGGERGVIVSFPEPNWLRLVLDSKAAEYIGKRYSLILTAGWSPLDYSLLEAVLRRITGTIFIQACNRSELNKIHAFSSRLVCLPTLGCDWINPDLYSPVPRSQRPIDLTMVANWAPFKRHWHLFDALRQMPPGLRVQLIGQPDAGFTVERVKQQAADYGLRQQIEFFDRLLVEDVQDHLTQAKVSIILSRHEGYCGAVTESMFADTPVGLLSDAYIGSKDYINAQTGVLLPHRNLAQALMAFIARSTEFRPREWAIKNISFRASVAKLNAILREHALRENCPWSEDIAEFCWRPYPTLLKMNQRLREAADDLTHRFPQTFGSGLCNALP